MPELPEVEIVKQSLNKSITGKIIKDILIKNRNLRFKIPKNFEKNIVNKKMLEKGKKRLRIYKNIKWVVAEAEKLPFKNDTFDYYTISFGLRNTKNLDKSLSEANRVLKPGGRYMCLEFSKIQNSNLDFLYKNYSKLIPHIGKVVVGDKDPYEYLTKSIEEFVNQEELIDLMKKNNFKNCSYRNLSGGIVAIHSGWKI